MGRIGKLLSFVFTTRNGAKVADVKLDPGGGAIVQGEHFGPPGDDSQPLPGDYPYATSTARTGGMAVVGYIDPKNDQKAGAGDKRIYARDSAGASVVELWLKSDGSAVLSNAAGFIALAAGGTVTINGVTIDPSGNIIQPAAATLAAGAAVTGGTIAATTGLSVAGQDMGGHYHTQGPDSGGDTQQNTSGPTGP